MALTAEQRPQVACPSAWAPPSLNGAKRGFPAGVSLLSGRAGLGPVGPSEGTDACSQPGNSSFCSCSICKKKQNRHFIVPASRFKLLKVSAPGPWQVARGGQGGWEQSGTSAGGSTVLVILGFTCLSQRLCYFSPLYIGRVLDITVKTLKIEPKNKYDHPNPISQR